VKDLTFTWRLIWSQWQVGFSWMTVSDMPRCEGLTWWETDSLSVHVVIGPLMLGWCIDGPRRNVRVMDLDEAYQTN
jgi:hypothetical protein